MKKLTLSLILFLTVINTISAQRDTTFWFAAPNFSQTDVSGTYTLDRPIYFCITTYASAATVTISTPTGTMPTQTITIAANSTQRYNMTSYISNIEITNPDQVTNQGVKITSTTSISVYYEVGSFYSPELFALKGKNALGKNFVFAGQTIGFNNNASALNNNNSINIVATEDNTSVTITPKQAVVGHPANIPYNITLNKGQTYAAKAVSPTAAGHLHGSTITSTKPIAITIGDDDVRNNSYGTCSDICGDQTVPIDVIGTEYIAVPGSLFPPYDKVFVTAVSNGTTISVDGVVQTTINANDTYEITLLGGQAKYITANKAFYTYLLTGFGCEFGTAILPKLNCTGSKEVAVVKTSTENARITLVVKASAVGDFTLNGSTTAITAAMFNNVPGTSAQWKYASIDVLSQGSLINVKNSTSEFHLGFIQGGTGTGCSVGYFSDFGAINSPIAANQMVLCTGNPLVLNTTPLAGATYTWTGPNITTATGLPYTLPAVAMNNTGWFYLNTQSTGCVAKDSIYITVNQAKFSTVNYSSCNGQPYLGYTASGTYIDTFTLASGCDSIRTLHLIIVPPIPNTIIDSTVCEGIAVYGYTTSGNYTNTFTSSTGCDSTRILNLTVKPKRYTTINQQICQGQNYLGYTTSGTYVNTFVGSNGCDSIRTLNLSVVTTITTNVYKIICLGQSYLGYTTSGTYANTFTSAAGCDSIRTLFLTVKPQQFTSSTVYICQGQNYNGYTTSGTYIQNLFTTEGCDSTHTLTLIVKPRTYSTLTNAICQGQTYLGYSVAGTYIDTLVNAQGCDSIRTLQLTVKPKAFATINKSICQGQSFMGFSASGTYTSTLTAANGCDSVLTINLTVIPKIFTTITKNICQGQSFEGYSTTGTYTNTFIAASGCDSVRTLQLIVNTPPNVSLGADKELCIGDSIRLYPGNYLTYNWSTGSIDSAIWVKTAGLYKVTVTNSCGSNLAQVNVVQLVCTLNIPNIFTPNNDGSNDVFKLLNANGITQLDLKIYNRWGQVVFTTNDASKGWNGTLNGKEQAIGVYIYKCKAVINNATVTKSGTLLLVR